MLGKALFADVHGLGECVDTLAVYEQRNHQLSELEFVGFQAGLLPGLCGIEEHQRTLVGEGLFLEADEVCDDLVRSLLVDAVDLLVAGVGHLFGVLGKLDLGLEGAVRVLDRSQFVDAAEGRVVFGCDQVCADTPGCDGRALVLQGIDQVLIQVVGGGDDGIRETGLIEHLAGFLGEVPLSRRMP